MNANTRIVWILLLRSLAGSVNVNWLNWVHSSASLTRWYVKYIASLEFPDVRQITRNWLPSSPLYPPRLPRLFNPPFFSYFCVILYWRFTGTNDPIKPCSSHCWCHLLFRAASARLPRSLSSGLYWNLPQRYGRRVCSKVSPINNISMSIKLRY